MATILVVSQSSSLSLALATTDHDIVEMRPADAGDYEADLYVVDLEEPLDAVVFLGDLSTDSDPTPTVVVIGDSPEWHSVRSLETPGLAIVERPVSRGTLVATVDDLLLQGTSSTGPAPSDPAVPAQAAPPLGDSKAHPARSSAPPARENPTAAEATTTPAPAAEPTPPASAARGLALRRVAREPRPAQPPKQERIRGRRRDATEVAEPTAKPQRSRDRRRAGDAAAAAPAPRPARTLAESVDEIVHAARRLQGLDIVACDVVGRAMAAVDGSAGALLLRDGESWCTAGGLAIRPREWMTQVPADSWLVDTVARQNQAVIVEDTDIARQRLASVPLARFHHLLAVPLPTIQGVLLVARDDEAFDTGDMQAVVGVAGEAEHDLGQAVLLREVADALHRFAERRQL
jgi:hypothetical protein